MTTAAVTFEDGRKRDARRPSWMEEPSPAAKVGKAALLIAITLLVLVPAYIIVLTSFSSTDTVTEAGGMVVIPGELTLSTTTATA